MDLGVDENKVEPVEESKDYIEMANDVAEGIGTLSVDADGTAVKDEKPEEPKLPKIDDTFMLNGQEYKVVYINYGKKRFTCKSHKGGY